MHIYIILDGYVQENCCDTYSLRGPGVRWTPSYAGSRQELPWGPYCIVYCIIIIIIASTITIITIITSILVNYCYYYVLLLSLLLSLAVVVLVLATLLYSTLLYYTISYNNSTLLAQRSVTPYDTLMRKIAYSALRN